jgi:Fur family ferric uptake transcriptional regulator
MFGYAGNNHPVAIQSQEEKGKMTGETDSSLLTTLEEKGIRLTRQRRILLDVLENAPGHVNARELMRLARQRDATLNRATVYRTLSLLKAEGLIDELDLLHLEGEEHFYERRRQEDHAHIGCPGCGKILELETDLVASLKAEVRQRTGFQPDSIRIEVRALCPDCQKRS